jgi:uncharacterized protein
MSKAESSGPKKVAVTGATGLVGTELVKSLESKGYDVIRITTGKPSRSSDIAWNPSTGTISDEGKASLEGLDSLVHLAGENVASGDGLLGSITGRWSPQKMDLILNSRVDSTKLLVDTFKGLKSKPKSFVSASAVGYYGYTNSEVIFDESSKVQGAGFLAEVSRQWENEALQAAKLGVRTAALRFSVILSPKGGVLGKLYPLFFLGGGGDLGSGKQGFSWVTIDDVVRAIEFSIAEPSISGPVNVCSPNPVTNADFTKALGAALNRPTIIPLPEFVAKTVFGQMGEEMLLGGQKVVPTKLQKAGFKFLDEDIFQAIARLVK